MDLGCVTSVEGVSFRNTHNRQFRDRSTRKFKLLGSSEQNGPWRELLLADLVDSRNQDLPPVETRTFVSSTVVRFIKFELLAFWGNGGGLQYFKVITGRPNGILLATQAFFILQKLVDQPHPPALLAAASNKLERNQKRRNY